MPSGEVKKNHPICNMGDWDKQQDEKKEVRELSAILLIGWGIIPAIALARIGNNILK